MRQHLWRAAITTSLCIVVQGAGLDAQPPPDNSIRASVSVTTDASRGAFLYRLRIETGDVRIQAVQIAKVPRRATHLEVPSGWQSAYGDDLAIQARVKATTWPPRQPVELKADSTLLPGIGELRLHAVANELEWDRALPSTSIPVVAPVILIGDGSALSRADGILEQVTYRILVRLDSTSAFVRAASQDIESARRDVRLGRTVEAAEWLRHLVNPNLNSARVDQFTREAIAAVQFDVEYVLSLLEHPDTAVTPSDDDATESSWVFLSPCGVSTTEVPPRLDDSFTFVGTLTDARPRYIQELNETRTELTFTLQETFIDSFGLPRDAVRVWLRGGTSETTQGIIAAVDPPFAVSTGTAQQFFVVARRFSKAGSPFDGELYVADIDTFSFIYERVVVPVTGNTGWLAHILRTAREDTPSVTANDSDTTLFLKYLRSLSTQVHR